MNYKHGKCVGLAAKRRSAHPLFPQTRIVAALHLRAMTDGALQTHLCLSKNVIRGALRYLTKKGVVVKTDGSDTSFNTFSLNPEYRNGK